MADTHQDKLRSAAVLISTLDRKTADQVLSQMSREEELRVRNMMVELGDIDPKERQAVMRSFIKSERSSENTSLATRVVTASTAGQEPIDELDISRSDESIEEDDRSSERASLKTKVAETDETPFRFLHETDCQKLGAMLIHEQPQTIAVVLAHLPPEKAAELLCGLTPKLQVEATRRLIDLEIMDTDILRDVERGIERWYRHRLSSHGHWNSGTSGVNLILRSASKNAKREILNNLSRHDESLARRLSMQPEPDNGPVVAEDRDTSSTSSEFRFSDLMSLDGNALLQIMNQAGEIVSKIALSTAPGAMVERIAKCLSHQQAQLLRQSLEHFDGPIKLNDIVKAQCVMARTASELAARGQIQFPESTEFDHPLRAATCPAENN